MLLRRDNSGRNAWNNEVYWCELDVMQKIWEWAKKRLRTVEKKNEMLLRTDIEGRNVWHLAANGANTCN